MLVILQKANPALFSNLSFYKSGYSLRVQSYKKKTKYAIGKCKNLRKVDFF